MTLLMIVYIIKGDIMKIFKNIVVMLVIVEISAIFSLFAFAFGWNIIAKIFLILSFIFAFICAHIDEKEEDD